MNRDRSASFAPRPWTATGSGLLITGIIAIVGVAAALSLDAVESGDGVKGDEATYVMMALSAAEDGDLRYERKDLNRYYRVYGGGPEGLFLKRNPELERDDVLFFGKAFLHTVFAAPFVKLAGLNGLLALNVLLLAGCFLAGYTFLAASCPNRVALTFTLAFFGASITPLYLVWLTPEILNFSLVVFAFFLWLYKEVAPPGRPISSRLTGPGTDLAAMALLGLAVYSKPPHLALAAPIVTLCLWRRQFKRGLAAASVLALVTAGAFGVNALITGEFNYQGGDRRTFYGGLTGFPFEHGVRFDAGIPVSTNDVDFDEPLTRLESVVVLVLNGGYFLVGRHFGLVPFFFPGVVAIGCALARWRSIEAWRVLTLIALGGAAVILLIMLPYSWSGGGGPSGNRYFLSFYGAMVFLASATSTLRPAVLAWAGGALFTAHILVNPFVSARRPYVTAQQGALRLLPVELTMLNDLPVNLDGARRVPYGHDSSLLLYRLDDHVSLREDAPIWFTGGERSELILRSFVPIEVFDVRLLSRVRNRVEISIGGPTRSVELQADTPVTIRIEPHGVHARSRWAYLLRVKPRNGFVPRVVSPLTSDSRYLGVQLDLVATPRHGE